MLMRQVTVYGRKTKGRQRQQMCESICWDFKIWSHAQISPTLNMVLFMHEPMFQNLIKPTNFGQFATSDCQEEKILRKVFRKFSNSAVTSQNSFYNQFHFKLRFIHKFLYNGHLLKYLVIV